MKKIVGIYFYWKWSVFLNKEFKQFLNMYIYFGSKKFLSLSLNFFGRIIKINKELYVVL